MPPKTPAELKPADIAFFASCLKHHNTPLVKKAFDFAAIAAENGLANERAAYMRFWAIKQKLGIPGVSEGKESAAASPKSNKASPKPAKASTKHGNTDTTPTNGKPDVNSDHTGAKEDVGLDTGKLSRAGVAGAGRLGKRKKRDVEGNVKVATGDDGDGGLGCEGGEKAELDGN